jgi:F-type H+-transporting ATPase subunit delta
VLRDPAAKRYAQAAFELARDRNELEAWEPAMRSLGEATASDEAIGFLADRRVPGDAKGAFLTQVTGEVPALTANLIKLLESKRRLPLLPQIAEFFQSLLDEHNGIAHAQVLTAISIGDDEQRTLASRLSELTGKQVQVEVHEAPEIIGGLVARIGDRLIDGSAKTKLLALKRELTRATR